MKKEIRDGLLLIYGMINTAETHLDKNPFVRIAQREELIRLSTAEYVIAKLYHLLADEADLGMLDDDGFPTDFQLKRINKLMKKNMTEFEEKSKKLDNFFTSLRHGDLIPIPKKEPSKCDGCGHVHD